MNNVQIEGHDRAVAQAGSAAEYQLDERWLLMQRVLASPGFQRAGQLRRILEHVTKAALLHPSVALHEYEIACEVLGRRSDFDPTADNIVRSQMSQLRRRLDVYFTEQSPNEPMRMVIAKGSYLPQFESVPQAAVTASWPEAGAVVTDAPAVAVSPDRRWWRSGLVLGALVAIVLCGLALWGWAGWKQRHSATAVDAKPSDTFVQFLKQKGPDVTIVVPDASLMLVLRQLDPGYSSQDYGSEAALTAKIAQNPDPAMREFLDFIRKRRLINVNEGMSAQDLKDTLARNGVRATVRFARDMHTRDFGEGNLILIGSRRSNPWTELFAPQTNFRFIENPLSRLYLFQNITPAAGEAANYFPYQQHAGKLSSFADVAFTANLTHSGYVLLINGSDYAANEAAIRYLLHGRLREDVATLLRHEDLTYFEILFSGTHADNDAEQSFDPIALRPLNAGH